MSSQPNQTGAETQWDAYSDYQHVSRRVAGSIGDAIDAISTIKSAKVSNEKLSTEAETDLRADVSAAVFWLEPELESERNSNELYDEILTRWEGEDGYKRRFDAVDVMGTQTDPWLDRFARDIKRAGWELGYLKAGSETKDNSGGEKDDSDIQELFEEMKL